MSVNIVNTILSLYGFEIFRHLMFYTSSCLFSLPDFMVILILIILLELASGKVSSRLYKVRNYDINVSLVV